jgi:hypothetical protein
MLTTACACLLATAGAAVARDATEIAGDLPDIGTPADTVLTKSDEYQIGA